MAIKYDKIKIVYYTGTGGTRMVVDCFETQLRCLGTEVTTQRLKAGEEETFSTFDLLLMIYPVYALNAPEPVYDWIESLSKSPTETPAVVISVSGGGEMTPNTACRHKAIQKLEAKGYQIVYENMLVMPSNIAIATKPPLDKMLLDVLPHKVCMIIDEMQAGLVRRKRPLGIDRVLASMGVLEQLGGRIFGKRIRVSEDCNGCGVCATNCPSGNITLMAEGIPSFAGKCHFCMSCLYGCPQKALHPGIGKAAVLKKGFNLNDLASAPPAEELNAQQLKAIAPGFAWIGVRKYISEE